MVHVLNHAEQKRKENVVQAILDIFQPTTTTSL
jgi:hypothetical protein